MGAGTWVAVAVAAAMAVAVAATQVLNLTAINLRPLNQNDSQGGHAHIMFKEVGVLETSITKFPFVASVQLRGRHHCGGSLFAARLVLTAAHCCYTTVIDNEKYIRAPLMFAVGDLSVLLGTGNRESFTMEPTYERRGVLRVFPHEGYDSWGAKDHVEYDIGLLLLSHEVPLSAAITLVPLKKPDDPMPKDKTECQLVGWGPRKRVSVFGCSEPEEKASATLIKVKLHYMENCSNAHPDDHVCVSWKSMQACMGDSGSPLVCEGRQLAIVGKECLAKCPGSYYRVDTEWQADWLRKAAWRLHKGLQESSGAPPRTAPGLWALARAVAGIVAG